jgi:flagellar hook protein FlgE
MFSGVSGLQAHQTRMNVVGNNIANVNTIGFKAGRVTFQDQLYQTLRSSARPGATLGGLNPSQVGLGTTLGAVDTFQTQGNLQTTGKPTDLAIQGAGFFLVSAGDRVLYTRDGSFDLDSEGVMVNPATGLQLLGYVADQDGMVDISQPVNHESVIRIPVGTLTSVRPTTKSTLQGNLNANAALRSTTLRLEGNVDLSVAPTMTANVYDSLGNPKAIQIGFQRIDPNPPPAGPGVPTGATQRWSVLITIEGTSLAPQTIYAIPDGNGGNQFVFTNNANPGVPIGSVIPVTISGSGGAEDYPLQIDFGGLNARSEVTSIANGQGGVNPSQSTLLTLRGVLNVSTPTVPAGNEIVENTTTIYRGDGTPYIIRTRLSNPTFNPAPAAGVPTGATQRWDLRIERDTVPSSGFTTLYDSSVAGNVQSAVYFVPGQGFVVADGSNPAVSLGSTLQLVAGSLPGSSRNQGLLVDTNFPLTVDLNGLRTTRAAAIADGLSGPPPTWNSSVRVFDSLGVGHLVNFQFKRALVGTGAPGRATARWEWIATVNGKVIADSTQGDFRALFFDTTGNLINKEAQKIHIEPSTGAAPFDVDLDFKTITQLAGDSSVAVTTQDGFPVGTLQTFSISPDGLITGIFSNGQTRTLGQIATAIFSNPAGMEKLGQNLFRESGNSGLAQIGTPALAGRGQISTGFLEMSNVDLSTEFTNLIVTQRGFQANTRIITIVDDLLQDVINLKR